MQGSHSRTGVTFNGELVGRVCAFMYHPQQTETRTEQGPSRDMVIHFTPLSHPIAIPGSMANEQGEGLTIGKEAGFWKAGICASSNPSFLFQPASSLPVLPCFYC